MSSKHIEVIPAILPKTFAELEDKVMIIKDSAKLVQVDICDGQFVPNATWPYKKHDDSFDKILKEEMGMPEWKKLNYEFDLMVNRPEEVVIDWVSAGAMRIILHAEARGNLSEAVKLLNGRVEIGMALNIDTPNNILEPYINDIQFIQCMGIAKIGFQGQEFDYRVLDKIVALKKTYPNLPISIDGGVSLGTAKNAIEAGVDRLVVGSAIFESENPFEAVRDFMKL